MKKKRILVAPMNWGLGHASRSIPLIRELERQGFEPLIASDGAALKLLEKEFPQLKAFQLPSYDIRYASRGRDLKWKLLLQTPKILGTIVKERARTRQLVERENISGIISDNRFGVHYPHVKNVYLTHQLNVLSGNTTNLSSWMHQNIMQKYDQCWVPDSAGIKNLSGKLGHLRNSHLKEKIRYIGALSRLERKRLPITYDYLVLISGPEPQRTQFQDLLFKKFRHTTKKVLFIRGVLQEERFTCLNPNVHIKNYLYGEKLNEAINSSKVVISRSGYTTLLDLAKLEKKAFFIPTPGQPEQEYLAKRLMKLGLVPFCRQEDFTLSQLEQVEKFSGLSTIGPPVYLPGLFDFFKSE